MILSSAIDPERKYRLGIQTVSGSVVFELAVLKAGARTHTGPRSHQTLTEKGYLASARYFSVDDESELIAFWQQGKGVALELAGFVPYQCLLSLEPVD